LNEQTRWVKEVFVEEEKSFRITLTVPAINASKQIVFLVSGKNKAQTLYDVLNRKQDPQKLPAQLIQGEIIWMLDRDAGELMIK
jgi:6-phosphogluconolactonase